MPDRPCQACRDAAEVCRNAKMIHSPLIDVVTVHIQNSACEECAKQIEQSCTQPDSLSEACGLLSKVSEHLEASPYGSDQEWAAEINIFLAGKVREVR